MSTLPTFSQGDLNRWDGMSPQHAMVFGTLDEHPPPGSISKSNTEQFQTCQTVMKYICQSLGERSPIL
jgi:hypothetical protein